MLRSVKSMTNRELIFLLRGAFLLGFALGCIGMICFFLLTLQNADPASSGAVAVCTLILVLFMYARYRRIAAELSDRCGF